LVDTARAPTAIPRAFALGLAQAGAAVAVVARSSEEVHETRQLIESGGGRGLAITGDVTQEPLAEEVAARTAEAFGPVDILINNAGVMSPQGDDWEVDPRAWWRTIEVNLRGPYLFSRAVLPSMIARRRGRIVNVSSGAALGSVPKASAYSTSKAALTHLTECQARATREHGIAVFAYAPGFVRTAMTTYLAESPDVQRWAEGRFRRIFEEGRDHPIEHAVERILFILSGRADALSGRHIGIEEDIAALARRAEEIQTADLYVLRLRT
jgi:NAD(P)-dependent dehydrogenase (short-subunit alcohol dehydrogenase family)